MVELIESLQGKGSGWVFDEVLHFDILINVYKPLAGSSWIPLPKFLASKKALINPKNTDQECFKWCVVEGMYPQKRDRDRITKTSKENAKLFNWDGINFPVKLSQINLFEKNNSGLAINVLGYSKGDGIYPIRISKEAVNPLTPNTQRRSLTVINLMLLSSESSKEDDSQDEKNEQHYVLINNLSRLVGMQTNKHNGKTHICINCFNTFSLEKSFKEHMEVCLSNESVKIEMPKKGSNIEFKNYVKKLKVPFVIYADFESYTERVSKEQGDSQYEKHKTSSSSCGQSPSSSSHCKQCEWTQGKQCEHCSSCELDATKSYTKKYQKHIPSGFCYYIVYRGGFYKLPVVYTGPNAAEKFCEHLEMETQDIYNKHFKNEIPLKMTKDDLAKWKQTNTCHICENPVGEKDKVKDHCHLTGEYRGAAHQECNLKYKEPSFIPVVFHNLSGYDAHLFIKQLGVTSGDINCIANTEEKYISFTKKILVDSIMDEDDKERKVYLNNRFIDSFKFMSSGLESLVKNLTNNGGDSSKTAHTKNRFKNNITSCLRKGVYPYDYMDSPKRLEETQLPPKKAFYSKLTKQKCSDENYKHAQKIWKEFNMKTMKDYHDLYLELDVLLLADVFENFREVCLDNYKLDPAWYLTAPGLSWDAMLKTTEIKLELLTDPDMLMMIENGTRGGVSMISNRYSEANNKYMDSHDETKPSKYIQYLDANNLYGWAMSEKMPYKDFKWVSVESDQPPLEKITSDGDLGYILEVDLEYPNELHDLHNDYPLAPETMEINGVNKLTPNLKNKTKYILHHRNLKLYLSLGLRLTKIHRIIEFKQSEWLAPYIALNTNLRTNAKNNFEKDFFKLMNNSVFGKTMENIRNRKDIKLVTSKQQALKLIAKPNFKNRTIFTENLISVHMGKTKLVFNKPVYVGMCILDISKTLMYNFHYNYIKPKYGEKASLLMTDTDSLCYEIETEDFYKDIAGDVESKFDTSAYPKDHPSGIKTGVNKKVIGMMKDECNGEVMEGFVGLRAKLYATKMNDGSEAKKCKGINKVVTKNDIAFKDYKDVLFNQTVQMRKMNVIRSYGHEVYTETVNKTALSGNDDKRLVLLDRVHTMAYGHRDIEPELHKVFLWMVQNFKLKFGSEMKKWRMNMHALNGLST